MRMIGFGFALRVHQPEKIHYLKHRSKDFIMVLGILTHLRALISAASRGELF